MPGFITSFLWEFGKSMSLFALILALHELGHIIMYHALLKKLPKVKFKFSGIFINPPDNILGKQLFIITIYGILFGMLPIFILGDALWMFLYALMCMIDIYNVVFIYNHKAWNKEIMKYEVTYNGK